MILKAMSTFDMIMLSFCFFSPLMIESTPNFIKLCREFLVCLCMHVFGFYARFLLPWRLVPYNGWFANYKRTSKMFEGLSIFVEIIKNQIKNGERVAMLFVFAFVPFRFILFVKQQCVEMLPFWSVSLFLNIIIHWKYAYINKILSYFVLLLVLDFLRLNYQFTQFDCGCHSETSVCGKRIVLRHFLWCSQIDF